MLRDPETDPILALDATIGSGAFDAPGGFKERLAEAWTRISSESMQPWRAGPAWTDHLFRAGVGAALIHYKGDPEMTRRIRQEIHVMRQFGAVIQAASVGMAASIEGLGDTFDGGPKPEPLDLMPAFREWRAGQARMEDPQYRKAVHLAAELSRHCAEHKITGTFGSVEVRS